jgi:hypothetical protein
MSFHFAQLAQHVAADGVVADADLLALRRLGWSDGAISRAEAEAIFALNQQLAAPGPEWVDFFVEALCEFVINGTPPRGHVDEEEAAWLIGALDRDGRLDSLAELELLVRVLERSANVPDLLKHYALRQVETAVLSGNGPTRCGGELADSHITAAECRLLRRMIFAAGGMRPAAVHQAEAELLFRLKDATLGHVNAAEWKQLFVQGVGNYLMAHSFDGAQLSHGRARELEAFMDDHTSSIGQFFGRVLRTSPRAIGQLFSPAGTGPDFAARVASAREVDPQERDWLDARIRANGQLDEFDQALLDFIEAERG